MDPTVWVKHYDQDRLSPVDGIAGRWKRYVDAHEIGERLISGMGRLDPGEDMGWHSHPEEELFFVIAGHGVVRWEVDSIIQEAEIGPLSGFYKVGNVPHQMVNTGSEPLIGIFAKVHSDE